MSHQEVIKLDGLRLPKVPGWSVGFRKEAYIAYYHDEVKFKLHFIFVKD